MGRLLRADTHKLIRYTIGGSDASFHALTATADVLLTIKGALEVRGVERPLVFLARARLVGDRIWVRGESRLRLTDFGIEPPRRLLFRVGNEVAVSFDVTLSLETDQSARRRRSRARVAARMRSEARSPPNRCSRVSVFPAPATARQMRVTGGDESGTSSK